MLKVNERYWAELKEIITDMWKMNPLIPVLLWWVALVFTFGDNLKPYIEMPIVLLSLPSLLIFFAWMYMEYFIAKLWIRRHKLVLTTVDMRSADKMWSSLGHE